MQRCLESVLLRAFKRNRIWTSALALCAGVLVLAPAAGASVTLGQLAPEYALGRLHDVGA